MDLRVLELDGSITGQEEVMARHPPTLLQARDWGPAIRMACSFRRFRRFRQALEALTSAEKDLKPSLTFIGSGDFHHASLALLCRQSQPINVLVLDNHPDWMRGVPFLHCGTWLYHAARLPHVRSIFHVGGDVDFDNSYKWLAPWQFLRKSKIRVLPAIRHFAGGPWAEIKHAPLRQNSAPVSSQRLKEQIESFRHELTRCPLYISLDKDVMTAQESTVNWDSGHLTLAEVKTVLKVFISAAGNRVAGMDIVGDWSPVQVQGILGRVFHETEHPVLHVDPAISAHHNAKVNLELLDFLAALRLIEPDRPESRPNLRLAS